MANDLTGQGALVTGGGRGLGECICRTLAAAGAAVVAADLRAEPAQAVARQLREQGVQADGLRLDVGDEKDASRVVGEVIHRFGRLDVLINNAGTDVTMPVEELSLEDFDRVLRTNLRGPFVLSKAAFPRMRQQGRGHIVNVVSTAA